jgi:type I restriction enzyme M protein
VRGAAARVPHPTFAAESPQSDSRTNDDLHEVFLVALAALGGTAGNGRPRETLEWDEARDEAVKGDRLNRRLIVPGRGPQHVCAGVPRHR